MRYKIITYGLALGGVAFLAGVAMAVARCGPAKLPGYQHDIDVAMQKMDVGMMRPPTGVVDRDFVEMMVPHHQGAIDMAVAELRYGHDLRLKRIAQEIIVDQQQEIGAMRLAIGQPLPASAAAETQPQRSAPSNAEK